MAAPLAAQAQQAAEVKTITLPEAINTALANNKGVTIARERYERSRAQTKETKAAGLPQLNAQARTQRAGPIPEVTVGEPGSEQTITIGVPKSTTAGVSLSQVLDLNRRVSLATDIAELGSDIQRFELARTVEQLILDAQTAYYNVLRSEGQRDVAQSAVDTAQESLRVARAQFEAGTLPKFDMTRAEVDVANRQQTLISAANAVNVNKALLLNVMGVDPTKPVNVQPVTVSAEQFTTPIEQSVNTALTQRPEMAVAEANVRLQQRSVSFAKRERLPGLALDANYDYNANASFFQPNKTSWVVGLNLTFPLYQGGAIKARVDQAQSDEAAAQAALEQAKVDVALQVISTILDLNDAYQRIQTAEQNVKQAEEALRLAQVRYQSGISLQVEVSDAQTALTQARTNFVNATYDYATALARHRRATATQPEIASATLKEMKLPGSIGAMEKK